MRIKSSRKILIAFCVSLLLLTIIAIPVFASIQLMDNFSSPLPNNVSQTTNDNGVSFNATTSYNVTSLAVYIQRNGSLGSYRSVGLGLYYKVDDWDEGGEPQITDVIDWNDIPSSHTWVTWYPEVGDNISILNGVEYMIQIRFPTGDASHGINWAGEGATDYGTYCYNDLGRTGSWTPYISADWDLSFRVYGTTSTVFIDPVTGVPKESNNPDDTHPVPWVIDSEGNEWWYINGEWVLVKTPTEHENVEIKDNIVSSIGTVLDLWGMNNTAGKAIVSLFIVIAVYFLLRKRKVIQAAGTALSIVVVGAIGWIPVWMFIVAAAIIGIFFYGKVKKPSEQA